MQVHSNRLVVILFFAQVLAMAGIANFAVLLPEFTQMWELTSLEAGWISGIFFAGYICTAPFLVGLTDSVDSKKVYLVGSIFGVIGLFGFAFIADGFWTALFFRFLSGIAMAGTYMPGLQILNERLQFKKRQQSTPWYLSTVTVGTGVSFFLGGHLFEVFDWHYIFYLSGLLQLLSLTLILFFVPAKIYMVDEKTRNTRHPLDFRPVFKNRKALAFILGYLGHNFELFAFRAWIVAFLVFASALNMNSIGRSEIGSYVAVFSFLGMFCSILGARIADHLSRIKIIRYLMVISFIVGTTLGFLSNLPFIFLLMVTAIYSGLLMADSAILTTSTVEAATDNTRGATLAIHSVFGISGAFLGPIVVGFVLDIFGGVESYKGWQFGCITMASGSLIGVVLLSMMRRRVEKSDYS
ncbi:MAG: hypothetical protein CL402_02930 [Acidiferrobacteraceae bacterium]|nr:hypothetical protein [Acidiferrobacteraceae bacterium]|tara:strand:+ start:37617 stop:38846 length:1230 start_codon:yes stop_codon:yes gene_type:complete